MRAGPMSNLACDRPLRKALRTLNTVSDVLWTQRLSDESTRQSFSCKRKAGETGPTDRYDDYRRIIWSTGPKCLNGEVAISGIVRNVERGHSRRAECKPTVEQTDQKASRAYRKLQGWWLD